MSVLRVYRPVLRLTVSRNHRLIHSSSLCWKDEGKTSEPLNNQNQNISNNLNTSNEDLEHIYKKKYEFIQKQNLEESYSKLHANELEENMKIPQRNYSTSEKSDENTFQLTQKFKLMAAGLAALVITLGGLQIYQNWTFLKAKIFGDDSLETFDEMYSRIQQKKQKKIDAIENFSNNVTNPNDSTIPGVYICGNNQNQLVTNDKSYDYVPIFKRLDVFDNFIVKDITMNENSGALINERGDLYQWGSGFDGDSTNPTIKGKNLIQVKISNNTIYALTKYGEVLYLPINFKLQNQIQNKENGWIKSNIVNYFKLNTPNKNIVDISAGLQHLALLDKEGNVYTTATGYNTKLNKSFGQFGLPEFSQFDEPPQINEVHDVVLLNKYIKNGNVKHRITSQIATGDYFTLCLDKAGSVWAFGKNTHGAIGTIINYDTEVIPYPTQVQFITSHFKRNEFPRCINIAAGGDTAYATFTSSNMYELFEKSLKSDDILIDNKFSFDTLPEAEEANLHLAWGHGLKGELGLGYFIHGSYEPKKIKTLNEIKEFNEITNKLEKIKIKSWAVGKNHCIVTLENNDVYAWGDNEYGQLGNGKRIRLGIPSNIPSLLEPNTDKKMKFSKFNNRLNLLDNGKIHQEVVAGPYTTAIVYKKD